MGTGYGDSLGKGCLFLALCLAIVSAIVGAMLWQLGVFVVHGGLK